MPLLAGARLPPEITQQAPHLLSASRAMKRQPEVAQQATERRTVCRRKLENIFLSQLNNVHTEITVPDIRCAH